MQPSSPSRLVIDGNGPLPPQVPTGPPTPLPEGTKLNAAPLEAIDLPLPINLAAALRLSDARPLIVAAAQARAWVAEAQLTHAKLLWVPTLNLGAAYVRHDGNGPDTNHGQQTFFGNSLNQNFNLLYAGGGIVQSAYGPAGLVSDSSDAPVAFRQIPTMTTDMIFEPLAVRRILDSRKWDIQTAKNDALLQTATAYFNVHEYRGRYAGILDATDKGYKLVARVDALSKDLVPKAEVDRSKRLLASLEQRAIAAREAWRVSSADLTQVLRLDPRVVIVPLEHDHLQITLIDPGRPLDELTVIAVRNRPEIVSQKALVQAAEQRIRREKWRPLLPSFFLNGFTTPGMRIQGGVYGTGSGSSLNNWGLRNDLTPSIAWQIEGFGAGNFAKIKEQRGEQSRMVVELYRIQDRVVAEVTRSQAQLQSAVVRVVQAERGLREALITFDKNYEGLKETSRFKNLLVEVYRPQEAVAALEHVAASYDEYFSTVADYNRAQFQLFHALGYPAAELAALEPPGNAVPVDTARPAFLPAVHNGPPPATH